MKKVYDREFVAIIVELMAYFKKGGKWAIKAKRIISNCRIEEKQDNMVINGSISSNDGYVIDRR